MLFKRKKPLPFIDKIYSFFWPKSGWKRYGKYILLRLSRLEGSSHAIAIGFACGVAISFTPFVGGHLLLAALTAFLFGGNVLASTIGTLIGNPWTFPVIWVSILKTGEWFLGVQGHFSPDKFVNLFGEAMKYLIEFDFALFAKEVWPVIKPMVVGCIPYYLISFAISYYVINALVSKVEKVRAKRRAKKLKQRAK